MAVKLAPSTWIKDRTGKVIAGPGDRIELTPDEEAALIRTGSAERVAERMTSMNKGELSHG